MNSFSSSSSSNSTRQKVNQNIQVYVRVRPLNAREKCIRSNEVVEVVSHREITARHSSDYKLAKKFTFDRTFGPDSKQSEVYQSVVSPLIEEVLSGYNCTVFAYGQTGTGKTHTMIGPENVELMSSWQDDSEIGIIPRALSHLFDELRLMEMEFSMRISYLELYNEELCDLLSTDDCTKIRIFDDSTKKGSVIIQGLEEVIVHSKNDVYKLLEKGKERRRTATTLMNANSSRSHTVFSILVHIKENGLDGEEMLKIGKLNLVDLAGSENVTKAGNERGIRVRETVNINQSLLTLGRVITALVERTPHIPYRESKLTRLLQESLGGRTKTSIIATISPGHKDLEETLSTLEYAHRAKNIQNKPEVNQKLTKKTVIREYTEEIDKLKRDLMAARDKNGIYLAEETYNEINLKMESQNKELNEKMLLVKALKDSLASKERIFNEVSLNLVEKTEKLKKTQQHLSETQGKLLVTKQILTCTKQRYKEKKELLDCHVKTEEELKKQADEILKVTDIATNDTVQLHKTIERRKDVDAKIQTACEQLSDEMMDSFQLMDNNLQTLQNDHTAYSQLIIDEISNSNKFQKKLVSDATEKVDQIVTSHHGHQNAFEETFSKFTSTLLSVSNEQKSVLQSYFTELKNVQIKMKETLDRNLAELVSLLDKQNSSISDTDRTISKFVSENQSVVNAHSEEMKKQLKELSNTTTNIFQTELNAIKSATVIQKELDNKKQTILTDFIQRMREAEDEQNAITGSFEGITNNLASGKEEVISTFAQRIQDVGLFCNEHVKNLSEIEKTSKCFSENVHANLEKCSQEIASAKGEINNFCIQNQSQYFDLERRTEENNVKSETILFSHQEEIQEIQVQSKEEINSQCKEVQNIISDGCGRIKECTTQTSAFNATLRNKVREYAEQYKNHIGHCTDTLMKYTTNELKTYSSTGSTPSKREFNYPRVLASTSPHERIIKRLRQENNWADLDATTTIDEDSDLTIRDISEEIVLNSTPIASNNEVVVSTPLESLNLKDTSSFNIEPEECFRKPLSMTPVVNCYDKEENKENVY